MAIAEIRDDERILVDTAWNEKELIKQVAGSRWNPTERHWTVPLTWGSCLQLRGVFGDSLVIGEQLTQWAWKAKTRADFLMGMRGAVDLDRFGGELIIDDRLYPFQQVGASFLKLSRETLLGDEMGTGKTVQTLAALNETRATPALVVCPNSVKRSWGQHVTDWCTGEIKPYVVAGTASERARILRSATSDPHAVVIVNYESLRTLSRLAPYGSMALRRCRECDKKNGEESLRASMCQVHPKELNRIPFRTVIIDEAHKIKSPQAQQTRAVWAVCHGRDVQYRWALTGTPLANHPGDLWAILHAISPRDFPTKSHFVDRYCLQSWNYFGGLDIVGINPATREEFFKQLDPRFRRMSKSLVLTQLPDKVRSTRWVELTPKQRKMYNDFQKSLVVITDDDNFIVESNALQVKLRQMQLSSATITSDGPSRMLMIEPSPKLDAMEEILDELEGKQVAICAYHRGLIDLAAARLKKRGDTFGVISGGVSEYERDLALRQFQDGKLRVLLFTISAGGTGLTMTASDTLVFLQRSWSMIENKQAEDRVHRIGSERHESIHIIDIVAKDSVEEKQIESLTEKLKRLEEITRDRDALLAAGLNTSALDEEVDALMNSEL